jgi:hypothetical protein
VVAMKPKARRLRASAALPGNHLQVAPAQATHRPLRFRGRTRDEWPAHLRTVLASRLVATYPQRALFSRVLLPSLALVVSAAIGSSCSTRAGTTANERPDGGAGASADGAPTLPLLGVGSCYGVTCPPLDFHHGASHCCTVDGMCGAKTLIAPEDCLVRDAPGGANVACHSFNPTVGGRILGCCASDGQCGGKDTSYAAWLRARFVLGNTFPELLVRAERRLHGHRGGGLRRA